MLEIPVQMFTHSYTSDTELARIVLSHQSVAEVLKPSYDEATGDITINVPRQDGTVTELVFQNVEALASFFRSQDIFVGNTQRYDELAAPTGRINWDKATGRGWF